MASFCPAGDRVSLASGRRNGLALDDECSPLRDRLCADGGDGPDSWLAAIYVRDHRNRKCVGAHDGRMGWYSSWTHHPYAGDRKSTRLNSSHGYISYAVFCLKKKKINITRIIVSLYH